MEIQGSLFSRPGAGGPAEPILTPPRGREAFGSVGKPRRNEYQAAYRKRNKRRLQQYHRKYREKNRAKILAYLRQYRDKNRKAIQSVNASWRSRNREKLIAYNLLRYWENVTRFRQEAKERSRKNKKQKSEYNRRWYRANLDRVRVRGKLRLALDTCAVRASRAAVRAKRKKCARSTRDSLWIIKSFYDLASRTSRCLGIAMEVDHVVPLSKGGKHTPDNLRVLPASLNRAKQSCLDVDLPEKVRSSVLSWNADARAHSNKLS